MASGFSLEANTLFSLQLHRLGKASPRWDLYATEWPTKVRNYFNGGSRFWGHETGREIGTQRRV